MTRVKIRPLLISIFASLGLVFSAIPAIYASTYGCGSYGAGTYNNSCSSSSASSGSAAPQTSSPSTPGQILLNDFPEYNDGSGKELTLEAGQVVYFNIQTDGQTVSHNITIQVQAIGPDYVDIVFQPGSTTVRFQLGQTKSFDVDGDGKDDIKMTLTNLDNGKATFIFSAVLGVNTTKATPATAAGAGAVHRSWLGLILSIIAILVALFIFFLLWRRRRKRDEQAGPH